MKPAGHPQATRMLAESIEDIYELAPLQRGMLFHTVYAPRSRVFVEQESFLLHGAIDSVNLIRAWEHVVERHSALRSSFHWEGLEKPVQVVHRNVRLPVDRDDWRALSPHEQDKRLNAYLESIRERGFDLAKTPLMRVAIFERADEAAQFVLSFHHILLDGWSSRLISQEVWSLYEAYCEHRPVRLPPVRPYGDFIAWLQQQDVRRAEAFWRGALAGFTAPTRLVIDRPARESKHVEADHGTRTLRLSTTASDALRRLARDERLTLNTLIQGAWAFVLSRYSGLDDVLFGTVVSGRPAALAGVESMVGLFINTLPLRTQVVPDLSPISWLKDLQARQLEVREYEYSELVNIQRWSDVPPGMPLFESIVIFENYPPSAEAAGGVSESSDDGFTCYEKSNYPLNLMAIPGPRVELRILYDRQRFEEGPIERMLSHVRAFLEGLVTYPDHCLGELSILTSAERQRLVVDWNATDSPLDETRCVCALLEAQAARNPDATAFICGETRITYRELNSRANRLARHLAELGVGPEALVGICIERSVEFIVGLLATFKAGGAYLPLDPSYPAERLAFMLNDAAADVLLVESRFESNFSAGKCKVFRVDADADLLKRYPDGDPGNRLSNHQLAYVIYTSGSTGQPKGVAVEHGQVLNRLRWMWAEYPFEPDEVGCQKTAASFVDSIWELLGPLLQGIPTVVVRDDVVRDPARLVEELASHRVTRMWVVPSLLRILLDLFPDLRDRLPSLKFWVTSGEALTPELQLRFRTELPGAVLHNVYGTSEVWDATWFDPTRAVIPDGRVSIGRPISNVQAYILDERMEPVPIGVAGELCIGGIGLARGYLGRPDLTAARFVPHPFSAELGARVYKTGDLARYFPDGNIELLGRLDQQVKLRGFRIEPQEIEAVLLQHVGVKQAAVVVREYPPSYPTLVAYVALRPEAGPPSTDALRRFLVTRLPEYMVPATFVVLERLPLTPSGKLDRHGLPVSGLSAVPGHQGFVAAHTPLERVLAGMYTEVLAKERVGIHDHFFSDLGGHSLLATQLVSRIRDAFQAELPLRAVFDHPTVSDLATHLLEDPAHGARTERTAELLLTMAEYTDEQIEARLSEQQ